jgi:hypothetical protein
MIHVDTKSHLFWTATAANRQKIMWSPDIESQFFYAFVRPSVINFENRHPFKLFIIQNDSLHALYT